MHFHTFFVQILSWPNGIIVGNLLASVVWSTVFEWRLRVQNKLLKMHADTRHNELRLSHDDIHSKLDLLQEKIGGLFDDK